MKSIKLNAALGGAIAAALVAIAAAPAGAETACQSQPWLCNNPVLAAPAGGVAMVQTLPVAMPYRQRRAPSLGSNYPWVGHALGAPVQQTSMKSYSHNYYPATLGAPVAGARAAVQPTRVVFIPHRGQPTLGAINTTDPFTHNKLVIHTGFGAPVISPPPVIVTANGQPTLGNYSFCVAFCNNGGPY